MPRFSFGITLYEYLNLMVLPGLEAFVHYFIRDILLRPYILPESITIPLVVGPTSGSPEKQPYPSPTLPSAPLCPRHPAAPLLPRDSTSIAYIF